MAGAGAAGGGAGGAGAATDATGALLAEACKGAMHGLHSRAGRLLRHVLARVPVHDAAHGCVPGRSVRTAVAPHAGSPVVLRMDLEAFFASIAGMQTRGLEADHVNDLNWLPRATNDMRSTGRLGALLRLGPFSWEHVCVREGEQATVA
jgi:hypothetical protein